ncbi:MAG: DUF413 domain-containing protein [Enterovibrio sp.]
MFSGQKFFDDKHFPKGFARSGYFTIKEAQLLESCGRTMKALYEETMQPQNEEQQRFVDETKGRRAIESSHALCWFKYLEKINHKHTVYNLCSTSRVAGEEYTEAEPED